MHHAKRTKSAHAHLKAYRVAPVLTLILALPSCAPTAIVGGVASTVTSTVASVGTTAGKAVGTAAKTATNVASAGASGAVTAARTVGAAASTTTASAPIIPPTAAAAGTLAASGNAPASQASQATQQSSNANVDAIGAGISQAIVASMVFCSRFEKEEYRIDCFANQLEQVSETTPDDADFGQARSILSDTASELSKIVQNRASKELGQVTLSLSNGSGPTSSRAITAVATEELPTALSEAELVLEEAKTLLLRASAESERRKLAYADMAQAVGSTKVLLRSA